MSDPNMEELSPAARALLDDARDLDGPTPADRDRNKRALVAALASGAGLAASTVASSTAAATTTAATATTAVAGGLSLGVKIAAVALVAVAVGGTALVMVPSGDPPPPRAAVEAPARARDPEILRPGPAPVPTTAPEVAAPGEPAPVDHALPPALEPAAPEAVEATPATRVRHVPATRREIAVADSTLSEELVLMREAQRALQAGRATEALGYLGEHVRRFPSGVLEEEREAQRVVALCRADRAAEARALASRFLHERPTSPLRERVRAACP